MNTSSSTPKINRGVLREQIHLYVQLGIMDDMISFLRGHEDNKKLQNRFEVNCMSDQCYMLMFKMINAIGYDGIEQRIKLQPDRTNAHSTLCNNLQVTRDILYEWALLKIVPGVKADWDAAKAGFQYPAPFTNVNLWMDSSDFPVSNTTDNSDMYSHKLKGKGIRVQVIADAHGIVRFVKGPCDPGQYDGHFLQRYRDELQTLFKDGDIIADNHYCLGIPRKGLFPRGPTFHVNATETQKDKAVADAENLPTHNKNRKRKAEVDISDLPEGKVIASKKKLKTNADHSEIRGKIEGIFGHIKNKFKLITVRKTKDSFELYQYVVIALAIHNMTKSLSLKVPLGNATK